MVDFDSVWRYLLLVAFSGTAAVWTVAVPSEAHAGDVDELVEYLPEGSQFAARVDVEELRGTKYFDRTVDFIRKRARTDESVPDVFDSSDTFDVRSDLNAIAVALPVSRLSPGQRVRRAVVAVDADLEESDVRTLLEKQYSDLSTHELDDGTTVYEAGKRSFVVPESNRLVAVVGPSSYRKQVWKLLNGDGRSFADAADNQGLLDGVDTNRMIWMGNRISRTGSGAKSAAVAIRLKSGVDFQIAVRADSESNAKSMTKRAKAMKKSGSESTMMNMLGAGPLLQNLELDRDGSNVSASTSMSDSEFDYLVERIRQFTQSETGQSLMGEGSEKADPADSKNDTKDGSDKDSDDSE